jgi:type VI protein secretion system component VasK
MRARGKPFVMYWRGPASFTIVPRGLMGWVQFIIWLALLAPFVMWFGSVLRGETNSVTTAEAVILSVLCLGAWLVCGLWWMIAHAEVVDAVSLRRDKKRERRKRERDRTERQGSRG